MQKFTRENAAEMARRATLSRLARIAREEEERREEDLRLAKYPRDLTQDAKRLRVCMQIEKCDDMLNDCSDPETFVKLTMAKERLWNLIYPKAGAMRPGKQRAQERPAVSPVEPIQAQPIPQPVVNPSPIVVPESAAIPPSNPSLE